MSTIEIKNVRLYLGNPYSASGSFLAYAAIVCGLVYLLIRRAPLKD